MGSVTINRGDGITDSAGSTVSLSLGEDVVSNVGLSTTSTYVSGGFDSLGNSYTTRPIAVSNVTVRLGKSGTANVGVRPIFKTVLAGNPIVNSTVTVFTGPLPLGTDFSLSTESSYLSPTFGGEDGYYGFEQVELSGSIEHSRGGTRGSIWRGTTRIDNDNKLSGLVTQVSIPSQPNSPNTVSVSDISANIIWSAPLDDGLQNPVAYSAANINGYRINYRNSSLEKWKVLVANTGSNALFRVVTGLIPSTYYEVQVAALNDVTDAHNTDYTSITAHVGSRSVTHSFTTIPSTNDIKVWDGTAFKKSILKVWDGSAWLEYPDITVKVWNGTAFEDVPLDS
jgi:hypothetical protein